VREKEIEAKEENTWRRDELDVHSYVHDTSAVQSRKWQLIAMS